MEFVSLTSVRLCWLAHSEDLVPAPSLYGFIADNECNMLCLLFLPFSESAMLLTWKCFPTMKLSIRTQILFKMLNTTHCLLSVWEQLHCTKRRCHLDRIVIPCGTDSYMVRMRSFSHLPPDPVLGCILHAGGGILSQHRSNPETTKTERIFHSSNDTVFLSSAAAFWKQKTKRQSCHPQAELAALQSSGTRANRLSADAREYASYWHQGTTTNKAIT